ncbi:hypothetical protein M899_1012 [Bacteriovorax sp. BSW11_IV]|uniref:hypothetical protein n=1 Tax=Bacteriovorax sp. BSW11_IV TaxID=1353529 RepID=UPI00038A4838|nr:hypothetical protein [Bacteriovorax sp. BSW11_IV]EQC48615.1 hypothetical protein M899_1012 [Bacteriovorax sp. BSW11_IV]
MRIQVIIGLFFSLNSLAQDFQSEQFIRETGCYNGYCISTNLLEIANLEKYTRAIIQNETEATVVQSLEILRHQNVSSAELTKTTKPFFDYMFQMNTFEPSSFDNEFQEILRACSIKKEDKLGQSRISERQLLVAKALCMKENLKLNLKSLENECDKVLKDTFSLIDLSSTYPGSFSDIYVEFLVKNPEFDQYIIEFDKKLNELLGTNWKREIYQYDRTKPEQFPKKISDLDLGVLAIEITGNNEKAIKLVQILLSDPGARVIKNEFRERLRREDHNRFKKLKDVLADDSINSMIELGMYSRKIFGMDYKRNWSNRNYKAIAGITLGYELGKRGHSNELSSWASQFIGEAYKIKAHIIPAITANKSIEGDHPYFVTDSVAHFAGADFGHRISQGRGYSAQDRQRAEATGRENSEAHWKQIDRFKTLIQKLE